MKNFIMVLLVFGVSLFTNTLLAFDNVPQITDDAFMIDAVVAPVMDNTIYSLDHDFTVTKAHVPIEMIGATLSTDYPAVLVEADHDYGLTLSEDTKGTKQYKRTWKTIQKTEATNYITTGYLHRFYNCRDTGSYTAIM